jgi:CBS domain-containing protein
MKISSIMTKEVVSVSPNEKLLDVAEKLHQRGFNGLPVVDNGKIIGMITESDLLSRGSTSLHIPSIIKFLHELDFEKYSGKFKSADFQTIVDANAADVMNTEFVSIGPDAEIMELLNIFQEKHVNPIPVVDEERKLVGIVSLSDIIKFISRFREVELDFLREGQDE